jgi:S1-C subfamily serine protease
MDSTSRSRWLLPWVLALLSVLVARRATADGLAKPDPEAVARVYKAVAPSVVRLVAGPSASQCGIIVSHDGLVLTISNLLPRQKVDVHLADGRKATGEVLGGSEEMGLGLVRITAPGPWPQATIQQRPTLAAGTVGIVLGYPRNGGGTFEIMPTARLANVSVVSATGWAAADCPWDTSEFGCGLFDLDGKLLGTAAASSGVQPVTFALGAGLQKYQAALEAGRCLDYERVVSRERLEAGKEADGKRSAEELAKEIPDDARDRAVRACVKVQVAPDNTFSGTLVDEDGIVVTCAHTSQLPGQRVTVFLSDGRKAPGTVLGTNRIADIGLIRLDKPGPWPGVKTGDSSQVAKGQPCLIVGYPAHPDKVQPERVVTVVSAVRPIYGYSPVMLCTALDYPFYGGMSGGGVFDREGHLVAVHCGGGNPRVELVKAQWKELLGESEVAPAKSAVTLPAADEVVERCARMVVSIERDGKRVALGTIVDPSGLVVTKSSLIDSEVQCKLSDGRAVPGKVLRRWPGHDLALLRLSRGDSLVAVSWSEARNDPVGTLVWTQTPGAGTTTGIIGLAPRTIGPEPTWKGEGLVESERGPLFDGKVGKTRQQLPHLKAGDVVAAIAGQPTANLDDVRRALLDFAESHQAGDPLRVEVLRAGAKVEVVMPLPSGRSDWFQPYWESARRSGFDAVATCDLAVRASSCGGPVFTPGGQFVGVCIASTIGRSDAEMMTRVDTSRWVSAERKLSGAYVIPASAIKKVLAEKKKSCVLFFPLFFPSLLRASGKISLP